MNGVAHIVLTVSSVARSKQPYDDLFSRHLGLVCVIETDYFVYWVGKGTAVG
jgi:catechol 2,3-dioxygenase-like lactoylglutathione lyase family enzyme